jgi:hypothetical protein
MKAAHEIRLKDIGDALAEGYSEASVAARLEARARIERDPRQLKLRATRDIRALLAHSKAAGREDAALLIGYALAYLSPEPEPMMPAKLPPELRSKVRTKKIRTSPAVTEERIRDAARVVRGGQPRKEDAGARIRLACDIALALRHHPNAVSSIPAMLGKLDPRFEKLRAEDVIEACADDDDVNRVARMMQKTGAFGAPKSADAKSWRKLRDRVAKAINR